MLRELLDPILGKSTSGDNSGRDYIISDLNNQGLSLDAVNLLRREFGALSLRLFDLGLPAISGVG